MRVLHLIYSVDPRHGGMASALRTLVEGSEKAGIESPTITLDAPEMPWLRNWPARLIAVGPGRTRFGWTPELAPALAREVLRAEAVIVHGLWQYHNLAGCKACRAARVPVLVFPHGMLDPWALRQSWTKRLTKAITWPLVTAPLLRQSARLCFTCPEEMKAAAPALASIPFTPAILPLGVEAPPDTLEVLQSEFHSLEPSLRDSKVLLFLGRLHPKKGCDLLIRGFAQWRKTLPERKRAQYHLRLAGPPHSPEYLQEMLQLCSDHGLSVGTEVTFPGMVEGRAKWQELAACSAMILPSHQENFGLVVGEALACGKPVLISNRVNIWPWIEQSNAGFVADDTLEGVIALLSQWAALSDGAALAQSRHASELYASSFSIPGRIQEFAALIHSLQAA
ncbi:MAG: hypothetical protein JWO08_4125 [Verrucomicrobiaceae bacterium]|nr:hypothetical protein [Verrucomicrobiaceae bacterium]